MLMQSDDNELGQVAEDLMFRAKQSREQGDTESAKKLLRAAFDVMAEETELAPVTSQPIHHKTRPMAPETVHIIERLKVGWAEITELSELTGLAANRVHSTLARLRGKDSGLQSQTIKRYRIVAKE